MSIASKQAACASSSPQGDIAALPCGSGSYQYGYVDGSKAHCQFVISWQVGESGSSNAASIALRTLLPSEEEEDAVTFLTFSQDTEKVSLQ